MKYPDIFKGMKIIRSAMVMKLISNVLFLLSALITLMPAGTFTPGSAIGSKLAIAVIVIMPVGLLLSALSIFRTLSGCRIAGSEDDNFNNARFILFVALLCNIASAAFSFISVNNSLLYGRLCSAGSAVCEAISVFFIVRSANRVLAANGETEISSGTVRTIALICAFLVFSGLVPVIPAIMANTGGIMVALQSAGSLSGLVSTVLYSIYLIRTVKALGNLQTVE